jgi:CheY-like chemotaxis protein
LLADLNLGQPGDGFTVVSAMRRTHPEAVTIIITGYPAFETALQAIRNQVDDYVVKPANINHLIQVIRDRLNHRPTSHQITLKRLAQVVRENQEHIVVQWLALVKGDPETGALALSDEERAGHVPGVLAEMVDMLETRPGIISPTAAKAAEQHGRARRRRGYDVPMLLKEGRLLRRCICGVIQEHLLGVDISHLLTDMIQMSDSLDEQLKAAVEAFLANEDAERAA